jgi:hypothetical protein
MINFLIKKYCDYKIKRLNKDTHLYVFKLLKKDGVVLANQKKLSHIWLCVGELPKYYFDKPFKCKDCGSDEVWKAYKQKDYFEERKGKHLSAIAIRCKPCRNKIKQGVKSQHQHMQEMAARPLHPNELFFKDIEKFKNIVNHK